MEADIEELITKIKAGDIRSFETLVREHSGRVANIIYHILGQTSDIDDLSQEIFIKVFKHIKNFNEKSKFSTWLYRISVNTVWDYLRKRNRRKTVPLAELEPDEPGRFTAQPEKISKEIQQKELQERLHNLIQELPVKYRTVLILKDIEGFSYNEIAKIMKCSLGTVESRLFRARAALRDKIKKTAWGREII